MLGMAFRHVPWLCGHAWIIFPDMSGDAFVMKIDCWRRLKTDHPYRLKIDQGELLNSVLYSIGIVDQTELVLPPFFS